MNFIKSNSANFISHALLLFLLYSSNTFAQSPYKLNAISDYSLLGLSAISLTAGQVLAHNTTPLSPSEIQALSINQVNAFDRKAIYNRSESARKASDVLAVSAVILPLTLLADKKLRKDRFVLGVMGTEVIMLTYGITSTSKATVLRTRPYAYNSNVSMDEKQTKHARYSMFSRHTAVAASTTFFAAKVYADSHPDSKWKPIVWTAAAVIPAVTGWAGVASGNHFPTDVLVGYTVGAAIGILVPVLHLKKENKNSSVNVYPLGNGLALNWTF